MGGGVLERQRRLAGSKTFTWTGCSSLICVEQKDAAIQKTEEGRRLWSVETAYVTASCALGSNRGWQTWDRGTLGAAGRAAQKKKKKTLWSNYMDGCCTEAGINDTAMRKPGAGLAPGLAVTAMDNTLLCKGRLITHTFGLTSHFTCKWDVLLWMDGKSSCRSDENWGEKKSTIATCLLWNYRERMRGRLQSLHLDWKELRLKLTVRAVIGRKQEQPEWERKSSHYFWVDNTFSPALNRLISLVISLVAVYTPRNNSVFVFVHSATFVKLCIFQQYLTDKMQTLICGMKSPSATLLWRAHYSRHWTASKLGIVDPKIWKELPQKGW